MSDPGELELTATSHRWRALLAMCGLVIITAVVLFGLVNDTRIWDDDRAIFKNPYLNPPTPAALRQVWLHPQQSQYNPLTHTLWWMLAHLAAVQTPEGHQLEPRVFHAANLLVHLLSTLAVYSILRRLAKSAWPAWVGALIFGIHPVQVETVAWVFGMRDLLVGLLCLVALDQYLASATAPDKSSVRYVLAIVFFVAAILAKATAVVLPVMMLIIDALVLRRPIRVVIKSVLPLVFLCVPCILWMPFVQPAMGVKSVVAWSLRPLVATDALAFYMWKLAWPLDLAIDYGRTPRYAVDRGWVWWTWVAPVGLVVVLFLLRRRAPMAVAAAMVFVAGLLPVLGIKRFDFQGFSTVADHYLYLPMLGIALMVAALVRSFDVRSIRSQAAALVALVVLIALGWRSWDQTRHWQTATSVWQHTLEVNPRSWSALNTLATLAMARNDPLEAESLARRAIDVGGDYYVVRLNLANALERQGRIEEGLEQFRWIATNRPDRPEAHTILARAYARIGRLDDAISVLESALEQHPADKHVQELLQHLKSKHDPASVPLSR